MSAMPMLSAAGIRVRYVTDLGRDCLVLPSCDVVLLDDALADHRVDDLLERAVEALAEREIDGLTQ